MTANITAPTLVIIPNEVALNIAGQKLAQQFRTAGISVAVDIGDKKVGKKISHAADAMSTYALVFGADELASGTFTLKNLAEKTDLTGTVEELLAHMEL